MSTADSTFDPLLCAPSVAGGTSGVPRLPSPGLADDVTERSPAPTAADHPSGIHVVTKIG